MSAVAGIPSIERRNLLADLPRGVYKFAHKKPLGAFGAALVVVLIAVALLGRTFVGDPLAIDVTKRLNAPSNEHPFGTDDRGRDMLARVVYGTRTSLQIGFLAAIVGATAGLVVGLVSGFAGGWLDALIQRVVDSFLAFPSLLLAMAFTVALGRSTLTIALALSLIAWPITARVTRASVLMVTSLPYIEAARVIGCGGGRIAVRHIVPNVASVYLVLLSANLGQLILAEASLSFLGVGVPAPQPTLGGIVQEGQQWMTRAPWISIFPGLFITAAVLGFSLLGDAIRDVLDPKLRSR
jgi:peptide/nickel transport system permease protein